MAIRVVLDTNIVLSSLLFAAGRLVWMRHSWHSGTITPLASNATINELLKVVSYPKFKLNSQDIHELMDDYLPYSETVSVPASIITPECRDPDDRIFLALAQHANANALITGDKDLLDLAPHFTIPILTPAAFNEQHR